jgi:AraC family transcriptional regulator
VNVQIVTFPGTRVAAIEHWGPPSLEHDTVRKLVAWKLEQQLSDPARYRSYGVHYTDPRTTPASEHHVEFCLSIEREVGPNSSASWQRAFRPTAARSPVT